MKSVDFLEELRDIANNSFLTEEHAESLVIDLIYKKNQEKTLNIFLEVQERDRKRVKEDNQRMYLGIESAMHNFAGLSKDLLEGKNSKKAKGRLEVYFKDGNIAHLIDVCKAYFPSGNPKGASNNGRWFFEQFKNMLVDNKDEYLEGGDSHNWAKNFNHLDYIELVLKED